VFWWSSSSCYHKNQVLTGSYWKDAIMTVMIFQVP
jgi:hypothetical protein